MNTDAPFISILIPAYNRPEFLSLTLHSVFSSTFRDFEVLVSDDHSPRQNEVIRVLKTFSDEPRLRWYAQTANKGWSQNRNFLVAEARGEFVWLMGDDDLLPENGLDRLTRFILSHPDHDIYGCGYEVIDENNRHLFKRSAGTEVFIGPGNRFALRQLFRSQVLPFWLFHPFTFAYKKELGTSFPYNAKAFIGDDLYFLFECMSARKSIAVSPDVMFRWRKFSSAAAKAPQAQVNLSSGINGIRARSKICDLVAANDELRNLVKALFPLRDFEGCFLHDSLRSENSGSHDALLARLKNEPEVSSRFHGYRNPHPRFAKIKIRLFMIYAYLRLTGMGGFGQLLHRAWHEASPSLFRSRPKGF